MSNTRASTFFLNIKARDLVQCSGVEIEKSSLPVDLPHV